MSRKAQIKFGISLIGGVVVTVTATVVGLILLSSFVAYFQQGGDPASIFRGYVLMIPQSDEARWLPSRDLDGKEPKQGEREEIIAAYWEAWLALERAHLTGNIDDLKTYWSGSAYEFVIASVHLDEYQSFKTMDHKLELTFYSDDGSVIALQDSLFSITQTIHETTITVRASATIVMTLDQGFWRIRQITLSY